MKIHTLTYYGRNKLYIPYVKSNQAGLSDYMKTRVWFDDCYYVDNIDTWYLYNEETCLWEIKNFEEIANCISSECSVLIDELMQELSFFVEFLKFVLSRYEKSKGTYEYDKIIKLLETSKIDESKLHKARNCIRNNKTLR